MTDSVPPLRPLPSLFRLALSFAVTFAGLEMLLRVVGASPANMMEAGLLHAALAFVGIDLTIGLVLVTTLVKRLRFERARARETRPPPAVSVLLPVWNEGAAVRTTVEAWLAQRGVEFELLVGDDGSTDGGVPELDDPRVRVFRFPHAGKGATLNALAAHARHGVLVTIDADTQPVSGALARLSEAFLDDEVDLAAGVVSISNGRSGWLGANQSAEYLKNALVRIAWSSLDALEQVPGAFAGIRASTFHAAGGFPTDSLTEDYELAYRFVAHGVARGRPPKVVTVLAAQVFTEGPTTLRGFIAQRTRWFAGFLTTLFRFWSLVLEPRAGAFGLVRFPLKVVDAVLPVLAFVSLVVLVRGGVNAALGVSRVSVALFAVRWVWDVTVYALALHASRWLGDARATEQAAPPTLVGWWLTAWEALTWVWLKHAAAFRGLVWAVARVRKWEVSRQTLSQR
jgi:cellulose synthase/poly-beta-1,6-N-acetylglucosamine synthase-like glycosyltransferase